MTTPSPLRSIKRPRSTNSTPTRTLEARILSQETLRRVDASQLPPGAGVCLGHCRTDMGICMGHPECADRSCQGHPCNDPDGFDVPESERDGPLLLKVVLAYGATLALCAWATWQWLSR